MLALVQDVIVDPSQWDALVERARVVLETFFVLVLPGIGVAIAVKKWGRKRFFEWIKSNTPRTESQVGLHSEMSALCDRLDSVEDSLIGHIARHDESAARIERSIERLTDRLLDLK